MDCIFQANIAHDKELLAREPIGECRSRRAAGERQINSPAGAVERAAITPIDRHLIRQH